MEAPARFTASSFLGATIFGICQTAVLAGAPAPLPMSIDPNLPEAQIATLGEFRFESGAVVKDFKVSYVTYGKLNRTRDNAILLHGVSSLVTSTITEDTPPPTSATKFSHSPRQDPPLRARRPRRSR